jgi:P-type Ca2+ transporter type 2C
MVREVHTAVLGRARFQVKGLYRCDALKSALEHELVLSSDVTRASASTLTGNVLVEFDPSCNRRSIVLLIEHVALGHHRRPSKERECASDAQWTGGQAIPRNKALVQRAQRPDDCGPVWHCMDKTVVVETLGSSTNQGLSPEAVERNRATYGPNTFTEDEPRSRLDMFVDQFKSLPVALLGVAAALSAATAGVADAVVIVAVVGINAVIGYMTERQAEDAIASLKNLVKPRAFLLRGGEVAEVGAEEVVVGDIVLMKPGTYVPADARIIEASHLSVDESILTGESLPVTKTHETLRDADASLGDRFNMVYAGTLVVGGHGLAIVIAAGSLTEVGKIRSLLVESEAPETPIERQLTTIGNQLVVVSGAVCGLVFFIGLLRGNGVLEMLKTAISLAVAAVPEGLPTVATTTLALGVNNMRQHKVLIRNLEAICTLGSVQTLCFDKTGTVTLNKMSVLRLYSGMDVIDVQPEGLEARHRSREFREDDEVHRLMQVCVLCNETEIKKENGNFALNGTATETALIDLAIHAGMDVEGLRSRYPRLSTEHRSDDRQFMATVHESEASKRLVCLKGSPLEVLHKCTHLMKDGEILPLDDDERDQVEAENDTMAGDALRVLGVGFALENGQDPLVQENGYVWLGLVGMADPLRTGAKESIQLFHHAGLETVMITGDQGPTAYAIGRELGLNNGNPLEILDSGHLNSSDPKVLEALCKRAHVFSRVSPSKKLQIVQALQSAGKVVAMTGDGINDGPALKAADIGIAMGRGGTDVARDVADVILEEDDLETLSIAIRDGRTIYLNIRKTLHYLLATNLSEIQVMFFAGALGLGYPLNAMQLLWINLISDIFPGLALAMDPPEPDVMERPPRDPNEAIVQTKDFKRIAFEATAMTLSSLAAYGYGIARYGMGAQAGTLAFQSLTGSQIIHALSCRSEHRGILEGGQGAPNRYLTLAVAGSLALQVVAQVVPGLRTLLGITPITALDGLVVAATGLLPLIATEATKERGSVHQS